MEGSIVRAHGESKLTVLFSTHGESSVEKVNISDILERLNKIISRVRHFDRIDSGHMPSVQTKRLKQVIYLIVPRGHHEPYRHHERVCDTSFFG